MKIFSYSPGVLGVPLYWLYNLGQLGALIGFLWNLWLMLGAIDEGRRVTAVNAVAKMFWFMLCSGLLDMLKDWYMGMKYGGRNG